MKFKRFDSKKSILRFLHVDEAKREINLSFNDTTDFIFFLKEIAEDPNIAKKNAKKMTNLYVEISDKLGNDDNTDLSAYETKCNNLIEACVIDEAIFLIYMAKNMIIFLAHNKLDILQKDFFDKLLLIESHFSFDQNLSYSYIKNSSIALLIFHLKQFVAVYDEFLNDFEKVINDVLENAIPTKTKLNQQINHLHTLKRRPS
ncbi:hypothetical protein [Ureaplasma urealyticum]|uniref:Uncharacterized protein n=3 Tax=Ureaplasma urealyticum TaxID=2130 RepID=A0AAP9D7G4_UREUR|nr:hypothetical protein [Ureaplasma urealyticum]EDX53710.1 conserved hypothetical protein [Ureaplasma urealyticum serovar 9 str. ATCC 33175]ACI60234.1 conserved hypothetical protein [Ureaplasma urealyticum serovar 10 str. ATCC 33699]EDT49490.1 conserved hypothetical protein [Ureaplasma urealyticum serovar 13 str. ATCC 33698]EDU06194.1 conserved hypothetical protein [Ureaplasma urealyticum serovar 5 str. ATCC 27817]EDU57159.1 conserved hypothetical protein [Ureaplasma urealyticum serovar 7 str.